MKSTRPSATAPPPARHKRSQALIADEARAKAAKVEEMTRKAEKGEPLFEEGECCE